ncbi:MAG: Gfo/Idh/MocA family oxidoreductase [Anaerolineae bacterium]|nr:Gfo/Idh/MocA family oxidoreductase [Anaerolineae bacterium]
MTNKVAVGIIGTGNIFGAYVKGCRAFHILEIAACADIDRDKAQAKAAEFDIPKVCSVEELLAEAEVQIVVNLTVPKAHAEVSLAAIEAGKHVYSEKPLAITRQDGQKLLAAAREKGVRVGCAPDTFLGGGLQTCRKLVDDGWIGEPVAAAAFMVQHGPESWHPNPDFFYQVGGGPLFDVGPYYLTALVNLLGPVRRVAGSARISFAERIATSEMHRGRRIAVEVPTHVAGVLDFVAGPIGSIITSFDVWAANLPRIEIYGSEGSLGVPDPNIFGGRVLLRRAGATEWSEVPLTHSAAVGRGIGVADMAYGIVHGRPHRASGEMAYHVLDIMQALGESSAAGRHMEIASRCSRPAPLPLGLPEGELDAL